MERALTGYRSHPLQVRLGGYWCHNTLGSIMNSDTPLAPISDEKRLSVSRTFQYLMHTPNLNEDKPMTEFDFDTPFSRDGTFSQKHERFRAHDAIPMWVADSDFKSPQCVSEALHQRVAHGAFGYTLPSSHLIQATQTWLKDRYDWEIEASWLVWLPGVVPSFNAAAAAFSQPGDGIVVQTPLYPPLRAVAGQHGCDALYIPTILSDGRWLLDYDVMEQHFQNPDCTLFILCNPMNPCGMRLSKAELERIVALAYQHGVQICSDEIHCDLLLDDQVAHIPMGMLDPTAVTLMAASKTFNIAGLGCSFAVIPDADVRKRFVAATQGWMSTPNLLGLEATAASFDGGSAWLEAQMDYLRGNLQFMVDFMPRLPGITFQRPEATFLAWLDCSGTGLKDPFQHFLKHGVALSDGMPFGASHCVRLNFGCSRTQLQEALIRMEKAIGAL